MSGGGDVGGCVGRMSWCCWEAWAEISPKCLHVKSIFVLLVCVWNKGGLSQETLFGKTLEKGVSFSAFFFFSEEVQFIKRNKGLLSLMRCMDVLRPADPCEGNVFCFFLASEATRGQLPSASCVGQEVRHREGRKKKLHRSFYLHHSPGVHYPDDITHAQTALFGVLLLIELLNDVESFKTNSVFSVWWLNDMDFHHCGCVCVCVWRVWWIFGDTQR